MTFELKNISKNVDGENHLDDISFFIKPGQFNTLLGPTLAGKTTLMRVLAGLDKPTGGSLLENGKDITDMPTRKRSVSMVYQQFINYPGFTVRENITSPLKNSGISKSEISARLEEVTTLLKLDDYMERKPLELSGGQQQRVALARALAKRSDLILLDEPLANLDYKLREELRSELPRLFASSNSTVVYATSEPEEALVLGGDVGVLQEGRLIENGPVLKLYQTPGTLSAAKGLSDPPLNILNIEKKDGTLANEIAGVTFQVPGALTTLSDGGYMLGIRAHHLNIEGDGIGFQGTLKGQDITGSETYLHLSVGGRDWTSVLHGIHDFTVGSKLKLSAVIDDLMLFDGNGHRISLTNHEGQI